MCKFERVKMNIWRTKTIKTAVLMNIFFRSLVNFQLNHAQLICSFLPLFFNECSMREISPLELKTLMEEKVDFQLVDVREPEEHANFSIGGILIPMNHIPAEYFQIDKSKPVVVYCRSGARSANVISYLEQMHGYTNLMNLKGGVLAWLSEVGPAF